MADVYEQNLPQKTNLTTNDYVRVVGSDDVSYKQPLSDVAQKTIENYAGSTLAGSTQSVKGAIDGLKSSATADKAELNASINEVASDLASESSTRASQDTNLQAQINQLVAPTGTAPNPAEIENARIGADNVTYTTLGDAIRTQFTNLKSELTDETNARILLAGRMTTAEGDIDTLETHKVAQPLDEYNQPTDGTDGQSLRTKGDGTTEWADVGLPTDAQTSQAVSDWLDDHPEATTTVQDGSLTEGKFSDPLKLQTIKEYVTPQMFGAEGNGIADDTIAFQQAINSGEVVCIPQGKYLITETITIPKRTTIFGLTDRYEWELNAGVVPNDGVVITFNPTSQKSLFVLDESDLDVGYCPCVCIKNLTIFGNANANVAIDFLNASHSEISNVLVHGFNVGLKLTYNMLCVFNNVSIHDCRNYNIHVTGEMSTTCRFYNCYIGQNTSADSIGLMIDEYSGYSLSFYSLTIESLYSGVKILDRNEISFYSIYAENTSRSETGGYVFSIGDDGDEIAPCKVNLIGGLIQGNNAYNVPNHYAFNIKGANTILSVSDVKFLIFEKVINILDTRAMATFYNCVELSVTNNIEVCQKAKSQQLAYYNCQSPTSPYEKPTRIILIGVPIISQTWGTYQGGVVAYSDGEFYIINISASANTNIVAELPIRGYFIPSAVLYDLSTGSSADSRICYLDSDGKIKCDNAVAGHVYKGQMVIHSTCLLSN